MERQPFIKRVIISDESVIENGITLPEEDGEVYRQRMREENAIWNGHNNGEAPKPKAENHSFVPDHLIDKETGILHLTHDEFVQSIEKIKETLQKEAVVFEGKQLPS